PLGERIRVTTSRRVRTSQSFRSPGPPGSYQIPLPEASSPPSGEKATDHTGLLWPFSVAVCRSVPTSHSLIVPSPVPVASVLPSGENATVGTQLSTVGIQSLVTCSKPASGFGPACHSLIVLSSPAEASSLPSGENATECTGSVCPR